MTDLSYSLSQKAVQRCNFGYVLNLVCTDAIYTRVASINYTLFSPLSDTLPTFKILICIQWYLLRAAAILDVKIPLFVKGFVA
jgi:hypothetical protein